jgi:5-methyltetrahydrofolate corrinoid/iron sulfur protein methyltransferase
MIVVGELINMTRKPVEKAWRERDADAIASLARKQAEAGADYIDVNSGVPGEEAACMAWLVDVVQQAVDLPLSIDTSHPQALDKAMERVRKEPLINSISAEKDRWSSFLPRLKGVSCRVVGLLVGDRGLPKTIQDRLDNGDFLMEKFFAAGFSEGDVFFDPCVMPVSTEPTAGSTCLDSLRELARRWPSAHRISAVSNISFGLPARSLLNRSFLCLAMGSGLDAVILNPLDKGILQSLRASDALLGQDAYCRQYLQAFRKGLLA